MTSRERLMRIFWGQPPDRPAVKLWALERNQKFLHPDYGNVYRLGIELTDLFAGSGSPFDLCWGKQGGIIVETTQEPTDSKEWVLQVSRVHTPEGTLRGVFRESTVGKPGYQMEHLLKEPADIKKVLSVPYEPFPLDPSSYFRADKEVGDRGVPIFNLDHAMYGLQRLIGSENFALWSLECREQLLEAMEIFALRIREQVRQALDAGIRGIFGWCGPELCIPPLMSPKDFDDFVFDLDKPLIDMIHEAGGWVWVHCHGKMGPVLEGFVRMGVDVLNPIEPPPMGDLTVKQAFQIVGDRMGLEGGIETPHLYLDPPEEIIEKIHRAVKAGSDGQRFILCASTGYMEDPFPPRRYIENLMLFVKEGVRCAEMRGGFLPPNTADRRGMGAGASR